MREATLLLTMSLLAGAAAQDRPAPQRGIALNLCASDVTSHEWSENLFDTLDEIRQMGKYPKELEIAFSSNGEPCQEVLVGCHSEAREIRCSEQSINRLLLASAWLAAYDAQQQVGLARRMALKQVLEEVGSLDFIGALQIADAFNSNDSGEINRLKGFYHLRDDLKDLVAEVKRGKPNPNHNPSDPVWIAGPIYAVASSELMAVVLGHEFAHAMGGCHLHVPSAVERSGQVKKLISMQAQGMGFTRARLSNDEILADECALRVLEQVDAGWVELCESISDPASRSAAKTKTRLGRRIALDAYAALLTNSLSRRSTSGPEDNRPGLYMVGPGSALMGVQSEGNEGYLYAASRLALVATTLHKCQDSDDPRYKVVLCESAARQFVAMLHIAGSLQKNDKSPEFADLFQTIIAPGVAAGLRTGVWHDDEPGSSYTCAQ